MTSISISSIGKEPTEVTKAANEALKKFLPFNDKSDFDNTERGFIATLDGEDRKIKDTSGRVVDMDGTLVEVIPEQWPVRGNDGLAKG